MGSGPGPGPGVGRVEDTLTSVGGGGEGMGCLSPLPLLLNVGALLPLKVSCQQAALFMVWGAMVPSGV